MLQSINSWLANQEPASRQRQCLLFLEEYHWTWGVNSCTHTTFWNHILHFLICMQQFWAQNTMSFVVPHPIFFLVVKTVIYLLLPYHPLQKNTCLRINGHIFVIKWWITIMLVSKSIWLYKPCKSVCSHKKSAREHKLSFRANQRKDDGRHWPRCSKPFVSFTQTSCWASQSSQDLGHSFRLAYTP